MAKVDIIILTYNDESYIRLCLDRLQKFTSGEDCTLTVIDNNSTDRSALYATDINDENIGIGPARNQGARMGDGEYICFIDSDVLVSYQWLPKMLETLNQEGVGLVGPLFHNEMGIPYQISDGFVPGACTIIKRELFEKLGGFDDSKFFYEDVDMVVKVQRAGLEVRHAPVKMLHFGGLSYDAPKELRERIEQDRLATNKQWNINLQSYVKEQNATNN